MAHAPLISVLRACRPHDALRAQELLADEGLLTSAQVLALEKAEIARMPFDLRDAVRAVREYMGRESSARASRASRSTLERQPVRKSTKKWTTRVRASLIITLTHARTSGCRYRRMKF